MATDLKMCTACKGCKEVMGMGFIFNKCEHCKGVDYVESAEKPIFSTTEKPIEPTLADIPKKTWSRKKKPLELRVS